MPPTLLHTEVAKIAKDNPAMVLSLEAIRGILLNSFSDSIKSMKNGEDIEGFEYINDYISVNIEGFDHIAARLTGLSAEPSSFSVELYKDKELEDRGDVVRASISGFTATIALHDARDPAEELSRVKIEVARLNVKLSVDAPMLIFGEPDYEVRGSIDRADDKRREEIFSSLRITREEAESIEGAMAYVMPRRIVNAYLSTNNSIDLAKHFTAFELNGFWKLNLTSDNTALVIEPSNGITIKEDLGCPITDSLPELEVGISYDKDSTTESDDRTSTSWPVVLNGVPGQPDIEEIIKNTDEYSNGFASLYAPRKLWDAKFNNVMPAIVYRETDNGFIGYDLSSEVSFSDFELLIDAARFGILINLKFAFSGRAHLTVDVPCVGRVDLADAEFSLSNSVLNILLSFEFSPSGKLMLRGQVDKLEVDGDIEVEINAFTRWLTTIFGGKGAVIGYFVDGVLARVFKHNIPFIMRDIIKKEVNSKNFQLLDLEQLVKFAQYPSGFQRATFSADEDSESVLVGITSPG